MAPIKISHPQGLRAANAIVVTVAESVLPQNEDFVYCALRTTVHGGFLLRQFKYRTSRKHVPSSRTSAKQHVSSYANCCPDWGVYTSRMLSLLLCRIAQTDLRHPMRP